MCRPCQIRECPVHLSLRVCTTRTPSTMPAAWVSSSHIKGPTSHDIVEQGAAGPDQSEHRGACGCEANTGDGAGILDPDARRVPAQGRAWRSRCRRRARTAPAWCSCRTTSRPRDDQGSSSRASSPRKGRRCSAGATCRRDDRLVGAERARDAAGLRAGVHRRGAIERRRTADGARALRAQAVRHPQAGRARGRRARDQRAVAPLFYIVSLSANTLIYKGMLTAEQLEPMFPDLSIRTLESALALVHQRFSTNTFPSWPLAHPYRYIAHNGEINTLRGNINWMRAREGLLRVELFGDDLEEDPAGHPRRRQRHGDLRQRARTAGHVRPIAAARDPDDDPGAVGGTTRP